MTTYRSGRTSLVRIRALRTEFCLPRLLLKDESGMAKLDGDEIDSVYAHTRGHIVCESFGAVVVGALRNRRTRKEDAIVAINSRKGFGVIY